MSTVSDNAVVLRLTDYSETSQIVTLLTAAHGLVRLIAKGVRRGTKKRFAAGLDLLERGDVTYIPARGDAQLGTLTEWLQRDTYGGLRREALRLYGALHMIELVAGLTEENDPHPELHEALTEGLNALAGDAPAARAIVVFQAKLLHAIGYAPELVACVDCHRPLRPAEPLYFGSAAGGVLCRDCEVHHVEKRRLPEGIAGATPATGDPAAWFDLLDYHLTEVAGRRFKTADAVTRLLGPSRPAPERPP